MELLSSLADELKVNNLTRQSMSKPQTCKACQNQTHERNFIRPEFFFFRALTSLSLSGGSEENIQFYKLTGHKQKIENAFPARGFEMCCCCSLCVRSRKKGSENVKSSWNIHDQNYFFLAVRSVNRKFGCFRPNIIGCYLGKLVE